MNITLNTSIPIIQKLKNISALNTNLIARKIKSALIKDVFEKTEFQKISKSEVKSLKKEVEILIANNFEGLDILKGSSEEDRAALKTFLIHDIKKEKHISHVDESSYFTITALGHKPATKLIGGKELSPRLIDIFNSNGYDVLKDEYVYNNRRNFITTIFNRQSVKKIIENNLEFYQKRLNLPENTSVDRVYSSLLGERSPFLRNDCCDLEGLTLGYAKDNTILYNLRNDIFRNQGNNNREGLKELLLSENSPYKEFSTEFVNHILNMIDTAKTTEPCQVKYSTEYLFDDKKHFITSYEFTAFIDEPQEFKRIAEEIRNAALKLKEININRAKNQIQ